MIARSWIVPLAAVAAVVALSMPAAAQAQYAQTASWVNLRAGPGRDYPLVVSFAPGVPISVQGCIEGYSWCDVIGLGGERGWIYAGKIVYPYQAVYVPVIQYGPVIGIPIVTFVIGSYWGDYYRYRPWYGNMHRWQSYPSPGWRPPPSRPPNWNPPPPRPRPPSIQPPRPEPPSVRPPVQQQPPLARPRPPGERPARPGVAPPPAR